MYALPLQNWKSELKSLRKKLKNCGVSFENGKRVMAFLLYRHIVVDPNVRNRLKKKKRSCALCKPQKTGGDCRWSGRDLFRLKEFEQERKMLLAA